MRIVSCSWASIFQSYKEERLQTVDETELDTHFNSFQYIVLITSLFMYIRQKL